MGLGLDESGENGVEGFLIDFGAQDRLAEELDGFVVEA